ncbi:hypothetical protein HDU84_006415 [Entophlyctis sp. JEL0112]|nr:hypothetical protein HDU84_006415 [Entophlyctis sp. JEL0112]
MATIENLHRQFEKFCAFGRGSSIGSLDNISGGSTMDGSKWAKFARDSGILDRRITSTEIDIVFNKVKAKTARRIGWDEFVEGVKMIAEKKYPDRHPQDAFTQIMHDVCVKAEGPIARATSVKNDAVLDRLTDVNGYTGTHKSRFDSNGRGLGLQGRDTMVKTDQLSKIVSRDHAGLAMPPPAARVENNAASKRPSVLTNSEEQLEKTTNSPKKAVAGRRATQNYATTSSTNSLNKSTSSLNKNPATGASKGNVYDRLTNTQGYTGSHKHRFNADGTGRGIAGRDAPALGAGGVSVYRGGDVKNLSQILRN